ncbi:DNA polymerase IV [Aliarcobacter cryaerophilus]|uniref:DNA polymerase Y family protein n=1 Tax=Aliarcobacter cryaerophilus TaxID=28198 RepID=UPI0021B3AEF0|nr:DNA polymerase IV [Aliarcobacter cryaerophilus]MCT7480376.1 DNA polymerase IV [Aliarcobacter cryaerophilus]MCT7484744.1 DNA polymerase IV [Aliarcobacter cryaerophilus]
MKIHLDLDCYFVSAERTRYPFLKDKNVVVAKSSDKKIFSKDKKQGVILGDTGAFNSVLEFKNSYDTNNILKAWKDEFLDENGDIHGIVIAKSYECKPYGIKTGTPLKEAIHMCPNLIIIPSDHLFYQQLSQKLKTYLEFKIPVLEQYSIDEFFGDLNGWIKNSDTLEFIKDLRDDIKEKFDLPITIGASKSKWIAKLLTDCVKPFGVIALEQEKVFDYTKDIDVNDFPGIGRAISKKLADYRVKTLGELRARPNLLYLYGKTGVELYERICGTDNERVIPYSDRRGIGISRNFKAIIDRNEIYRRVMILARYLSYTITKLNLNPTTFYFKIRYEYGIKNSQSITENRLFNEKFLIDLAKFMIKKLDTRLNYKIHYIAISASNFASDHNIKTFCLIDYKKDLKYKELNENLLKVRDKYGIDIVKYASEELV